MRKSEWTLLAFDDGSKLFVATRDLSPTIFHFKEKWKQLFDLGILRGATGRGGGEGWGRGAVGKVGEVRAIKNKRTATMGGMWGERMWIDGRKGEHVRKTAGTCVCVYVCRVSLSVSLQHVGILCR